VARRRRGEIIRRNYCHDFVPVIPPSPCRYGPKQNQKSRQPLTLYSDISIARHCVSVRTRKTNGKPPVNLRDPIASSPVERASSDAEAENLRVSLERTTAEMDNLSPPPPGIERQYLDGPLGVRTRNRKREHELAVENLERLAANREYPTARLTLIWLWQWNEVTQALTEDSKADLEAELPEIQHTLSLFERERAMISDARGVDEAWKNEKLASLDDMIKKNRRALEAIGRAVKQAGPGRPRRPEAFDDLITAFALLVAVQHGAERPASYREVAEALLFWSPESRVQPTRVRDIKRTVANRIRTEAGRAKYPISALLSKVWAADLRRVQANRRSRR
jgi:hypothetical protein